MCFYNLEPPTTTCMMIGVEGEMKWRGQTKCLSRWCWEDHQVFIICNYSDAEGIIKDFTQPIHKVNE